MLTVIIDFRPRGPAFQHIVDLASYQPDDARPVWSFAYATPPLARTERLLVAHDMLHRAVFTVLLALACKRGVLRQDVCPASLPSFRQREPHGDKRMQLDVP